MTETQLIYWYAVAVLGGFENKAKTFLQENFSQYQYLLPSRILQIRRAGQLNTETKPLFSGYLFLGSAKSLSLAEARSIIRAYSGYGPAKGAVKVLGEHNDDGIVAIPPEEMQWILHLTSENETLGVSQFFKEGAKVIITGGALKGKEVVIRKVNPRKRRITIAIEMFGKEHLIDFAAEQIENAEISV